MEQSQYIDQIRVNFPGIVLEVVTRLNGSTNPARSYRWRNELKKVYSPDLSWNSFTISNRLVAADVVAMDSSLPLKKRDSIGKFGGKIPKTGMELALREEQLQQLHTLSRMPNRESQFLAALFGDTKRVIEGQYELFEYMYLLGLSTGVTLIADANNVGTGIRADFGYPDANKFGVTALWSDATNATPFADLARVKAKAQKDGRMIVKFKLDEPTLNQIRATAEARNMFAASIGYFGTSAPMPTTEQVNNLVRTNYGYVFDVVDRSVTFEKNGIDTVLTPWEPGMVIGQTSEQVGTFTWGTPVEADSPVAGVEYQTADGFILVSKFRENRPSIAEFTNSQSFALPVINGSGIYQLDSTTIQA